jgi:hypothetical protein
MCVYEQVRFEIIYNCQSLLSELSLLSTSSPPTRSSDNGATFDRRRVITLKRVTDEKNVLYSRKIIAIRIIKPAGAG